MNTQTLNSSSSPFQPLCCSSTSCTPLANSFSFPRFQWLGLPLLACRPPSKSRSAFSSCCRSNTRFSGFAVCKAPSLGEDRFEEDVLKSDVPVLVDFWAEWCGPCKLVAPLMDWASEEYKGTLKVYKIDTDANSTLVERYKVYGLPTLLLFKDGNEVPGSRREGAINKKKLKILLDELLASVATP